MDSANVSYEATAEFCEFLMANHSRIPFSVENPLNSYMGFASVIPKLNMAGFDACRHGSRRKKATAFLTNEPALLTLSGACPGCTVPATWGRKPNSGLNAADEAAYPRLLCERIVACFNKVADRRGLLPDPVQAGIMRAARAAAQVQPRRRKFPPLISEFAYTMRCMAVSSRRWRPSNA